MVCFHLKDELENLPFLEKWKKSLLDAILLLLCKEMLRSKNNLDTSLWHQTCPCSKIVEEGNIWMNRNFLSSGPTLASVAMTSLIGRIQTFIKFFIHIFLLLSTILLQGYVLCHRMCQDYSSNWTNKNLKGPS